MIRPVFVDTSAWYALADTDDTNHEQAVSLLGELRHRHRRMLTTNHVIGETYTLVRARLGLPGATKILTQFRTSSIAQRVNVTEVWETAAEDLLTRYGDQPFSYVDATSFVVMNRLNLDEAFAFDNHFPVAGFLLYR